MLDPSFKLHKCLSLGNKQEAIENYRKFHLQEKECMKKNNDDLTKWTGCKTQGINTFNADEETNKNDSVTDINSNTTATTATNANTATTAAAPANATADETITENSAES